MDWSEKLYFAASFVIVAAASIPGIHGYAMVSGTVFCDQCKDGQVTLFDYPLNGIKVGMACPGNDGQMTRWGEDTTNWLGSFAMRLDGMPDLTGCVAQVTSSSEQGTRGCGIAGGPGRSPRLIFRMFNMEMYTVDPLISQPDEAMSFCSKSSSYPHPNPNPVSPTLPPHLPPMPPFPYLEDSACPHQRWTMPENRCYWKVVTPDSKVGVVFGLIAARTYGTDITLWQGMKGRGEPYKTLLREATTALLNSYNTIHFPYHPLAVIQHMNWALLGSTHNVLHTALTFMRANSGPTCNFTPCN